MEKRKEDIQIRTPWRQRLRLWRQRYVPLIVWVGAIAVALSISRRDIRQTTAVGIVEAREIPVVPLQDGVVQGIGVDLFDTVDQGQTVAVMDDTILRSELRVAEAELGRLRAELELARQEARLRQDGLVTDRANDLRRFALDEEEARLAHLDRLVIQESDQVELQRLEVLLNRQMQLAADGMIDTMTLDDTRLQYETMETRIRKNDTAIAEARERIETARKRQETRQAQELDFRVDAEIGPFNESLKVQEAAIQRLSEQRRQLVLRAPLAGKVSRILAATGETIASGTPLLMISEVDGVRVVGYVDESRVREIQVGAAVEVISRHVPHDVVQAKIVEVGPGMQEVPDQLRRHPNFPQWGLPILVGDVPKGMFRPGETLDLRLITAR